MTRKFKFAFKSVFFFVKLEKWSFHVAGLPRTGKKCTEIRKSRCMKNVQSFCFYLLALRCFWSALLSTAPSLCNLLPSNFSTGPCFEFLSWKSFFLDHLSFIRNKTYTSNVCYRGVYMCSVPLINFGYAWQNIELIVNAINISNKERLCLIEGLWNFYVHTSVHSPMTTFLRAQQCFVRHSGC